MATNLFLHKQQQQPLAITINIVTNHSSIKGEESLPPSSAHGSLFRKLPSILSLSRGNSPVSSAGNMAITQENIMITNDLVVEKDSLQQQKTSPNSTRNRGKPRKILTLEYSALVKGRNRSKSSAAAAPVSQLTATTSQDFKSNEVQIDIDGAGSPHPGRNTSMLANTTDPETNDEEDREDEASETGKSSIRLGAEKLKKSASSMALIDDMDEHEQYLLEDVPDPHQEDREYRKKKDETRSIIGSGRKRRGKHKRQASSIKAASSTPPAQDESQQHASGDNSNNISIVPATPESHIQQITSSTSSSSNLDVPPPPLSAIQLSPTSQLLAAIVVASPSSTSLMNSSKGRQQMQLQQLGSSLSGNMSLPRSQVDAGTRSFSNNNNQVKGHASAGGLAAKKATSVSMGKLELINPNFYRQLSLPVHPGFVTTTTFRSLPRWVTKRIPARLIAITCLFILVVILIFSMGWDVYQQSKASPQQNC